MQWCVVKIGAALFDLLHAYGLGIVLASACRQPIMIRERGATYSLFGTLSVPPSAPLDLLDEVLCLPTPEAVASAQLPQVELPVANLDGLLTLLFTTPGAVRALSVADIRKKARRQDEVIERAITKARLAVARWKDLASKEPLRGAGSWLERVLQDYDALTPAIPTPAEARTERELSLVMMLDPSFSHSTHRPRSDGLISRKTQVAIRGTRFAVLLAQVGAARFLRAHRVSGNLVNCYVPKAKAIRLERDSCLPILSEMLAEASQAALVHWLTYASHSVHAVHAQWTGVAYQTLQTQGTQQSIPRGQGVLELIWLTGLSISSQAQLLAFWRMLLSLPADRSEASVDALLDMLWTRSLSRWEQHLLERARSLHAAKDPLRAYSLEELKEVTCAMTTSVPSLLKKALEQKGGTLRFGQAMRLLGEVNGAALRELVEALEAVTTLEQLFDVLAQIAESCKIAAAKTKFMVVPDEDDLGALLSDVEQSSVQTIARFLIVLSAIRYPRPDSTEQDIGRLWRVISLLLMCLSRPEPDSASLPPFSANASTSEGSQIPDQEHPTDISIDQKGNGHP
jgi:hypothetical protein